ncbi:mannose-6-phosphate isomerase, class I [Mammaliicoccus stepanovicii]|uniref:Mannose-6-phosphate isomerase n=1 Tax=Mammaliicoccus stepanovicii TaxID=643214 RepID=A0A239YKS7_9STAP|nr:mannose-6-phosphate isomerase, class I [Mammaliicoccus stepanovicii]PNZ75573.1 mannose-6-phosphate isomerase, class I [Mammaliicoccus stepanovicii]GGI41133.1 mannose-6-phosphate isomerase, class I [Mammaliicoccus stepanovicii]SNV59851.1 mannose-6-phosphate isomerase [Mammaliicoccus stepanovicii]
MSPLVLKPVFKERIWGGRNLEKMGYNLPEGNIGECWGISAHKNGANEIANGPYKGKTLDEVWKEEPQLFGNPTEEKFPLLTKILDANDKLSVQVHPNDEYANIHENGELGKTECWYVIDAKENAEIIYGTYANTKNQLESFIQNEDWDHLFKRIKVEPGDFFYVPSGTVHAIGSGIMILETQQNSDTTYRIFDYDRTDKDGNKRALHLDKSIDVINVGSESPNVPPKKLESEEQKGQILVENEFFTVAKWQIEGTFNFRKPRDYCLVSIISGSGEIITDGNVFEVKIGDHLILTADDLDNNINGNLEVIISYV